MKASTPKTPGELLALNKAVVDFLLPSNRKHGDPLQISYDNTIVDLSKAFGKSPEKLEVPTATEFFERVRILATEVPHLRSSVTVIKSSPDMEAIPLDILHKVVCSLFPPEEQRLRNLVLDNVAIAPRGPQATPIARTVSLERLQISNSPALLANPELLEQLLGIFVDIKELVLVGGPQVADAHIRSRLSQDESFSSTLMLGGAFSSCLRPVFTLTAALQMS